MVVETYVVATDDDFIPRETTRFAQLRAKIGHPAIRIGAVFGKQGALNGGWYLTLTEETPDGDTVRSRAIRGYQTRCRAF